MYECFHCGERAVTWQADFDLADYGYVGDGIVHVCHCNNCGADIEYIIQAKERKMTREEAIRDLETLKDYFEEESGGAIPLCLDVAIHLLKADEKETSDELI